MSSLGTGPSARHPGPDGGHTPRPGLWRHRNFRPHSVRRGPFAGAPMTRPVGARPFHLTLRRRHDPDARRPSQDEALEWLADSDYAGGSTLNRRRPITRFRFCRKHQGTSNRVDRIGNKTSVAAVSVCSITNRRCQTRRHKCASAHTIPAIRATRMCTTRTATVRAVSRSRHTTGPPALQASPCADIAGTCNGRPALTTGRRQRYGEEFQTVQSNTVQGRKNIGI